MIYEKTTCRLCASPVREVLRLKPTPLANSFPLEPNSGEFIPLNLNQCVSCGHVQTSHVVNGEALYSDYRYSTPEAVRPHLERAARMLKERYPHARRVLEIGCNNELNLDVLEDHSFEVVGIDPAVYESHRTVRGYFNLDTASRLGKFDLIVANNVFAHIDDLSGVFDGINECLLPNGALIFEVQYLPDMVRNVGFDMIYHEHHDYHSLKPLARFLRRFGLTLTAYEFLETHGGSVRVICRRNGTEAQIPEYEADWTAFACAIELSRLKNIGQLQWVGERMILFGAPAKACTLIHQFGIAEYFMYCVDSTKEKWGRYIPGTSIKIREEETLERSKSQKNLFLAAWNYADVIRKRYPDARIITPWRPEKERVAA